MTISTPDATPNLNILIYGDPGVGKTVLSATAQDHEKTAEVLYLSAEAGLTSIRYRDISTVEITSYEEFTEMYDFLRTHLELRKQGKDDKLLDLHNKHHGEEADEPTLYNTVVLDTLTEIQKYCMYDIMDEDYESDLEQDVDQPQIRDWYQAGEKMAKLVRAFRNLNVNVIFTAWAETDIEDCSGKKFTVPLLSGKIQDTLPGYLDIVGHMRTKENDDGEIQRWLITQPIGNVIAKDRTDSLGKGVKNPTIPKIFNTVYSQE